MTTEGETTVWMSSAKCRELPPGTFFPSDGTGVARAQAVCRGCDVRERCLDCALTKAIEQGVRDGTSDRECRRLRRLRKRTR